MNPVRPLSALVALGLVAGAGWYFLRTPDTGTAPVPAPTPKVAAPTAAPTPAQPIQAPGPQAKPQPAAGKVKMWKLPDGTEVPPLNGVTDPPPFAWEAGRPYSPIVRTVTDKDGVAWYEHQDGCRTTTQMMFRKDLGRMDANSICQAPKPAVPILPEELEQPGAGSKKPAGNGK